MSTSEKFVIANGLNIHYAEYGNENGYPLLLLHGGSANLESWADHLAYFTPHFRVIAPDTRGHGKTVNTSDEFTYRVMADDVAAFIRALNLNKPLIFGYSDGGQIGLELGIHHPDAARAIVLGGTQYTFSGRYLDALRGMGMTKPGFVDIDHIMRTEPDWIEYMKAAHPRPDDPDYWKSLFNQLSTLWWTPVGYVPEDFKKMIAPTLIIMGDRDGIPIEEAAHMYNFLPNAELAIIPNADHGSALNEVFMTIVRDFLLRHSQSSA
jgi:pimeloyl-ACP methyl ester carboxylesterase